MNAHKGEYDKQLLFAGIISLILSGCGQSANETAQLPVVAADEEEGIQVHFTHADKYQEDRIEIPLPANTGIEYKFQIEEGEPLLYSWTFTGDPIHFEFHGEPTEGDWPEGFYQSYELSDDGTGGHGSFVAPFTGQHGWYWANRTNADITIVLEAAGYYTWHGPLEVPPL